MKLRHEKNKHLSPMMRKCLRRTASVEKKKNGAGGVILKTH
jgi:hypothetical protein